MLAASGRGVSKISAISAGISPADTRGLSIGRLTGVEILDKVFPRAEHVHVELVGVELTPVVETDETEYVSEEGTGDTELEFPVTCNDEQGVAESEDESILEVSCKEDGIIFIIGTAFRLNGHKPHLAKPALIFGIENALSNGDLIIREKSLFETTKFFLANVRERTDFEK